MSLAHHNHDDFSTEDEKSGVVFTTWNEPERSWTLEVGLRLSQLLLIFGGIVPYIPQYLEISRTRNPVGFSPFVCLAIVVASSLRICYWFGRDYDLAIFFQSVVMVAVMLAMLELCLRVQGRPRIQRNFLDFDVNYFWRWTNILSFVQFITVFIAFFAFLVLCFGWIPGVLPAVAVLALVVEAGLAVPQFVRNWFNNSTEGLNKAMVCFWAFGDVYKLLYYILRNVPYPFVGCVIFQLGLDLAILTQIFTAVLSLAWGIIGLILVCACFAGCIERYYKVRRHRAAQERGVAVPPAGTYPTASAATLAAGAPLGSPWGASGYQPGVGMQGAYPQGSVGMQGAYPQGNLGLGMQGAYPQGAGAGGMQAVGYVPGTGGIQAMPAPPSPGKMQLGQGYPKTSGLGLPGTPSKTPSNQ